MLEDFKDYFLTEDLEVVPSWTHFVPCYDEKDYEFVTVDDEDNVYYKGRKVILQSGNKEYLERIKKGLESGMFDLKAIEGMKNEK